jgi:carboxyl-terminal processing protease
MKKLVCFLFIALLFFGCKKEDLIVKNTSNLSFEVRIYLLDMIDIMKVNSINRLTIDWPKFSSDVLTEAGNAKTINEAEPALKLALKLLGDNHSFIQTKNSKYLIGSNVGTYVANADFIGAVPENIGYVRVLGNFQSSTDPSILAINIQNEIKTADKVNLKGWIVDLRGNDGGNMWPMLAGLQPLLGDGLLGYFIDPIKIETPWYANIQKVPENYVLKKGNPKVAVLINQSIGSSGEAAVIAFKGRPNTKFFGTPTFGVSTANQNFFLTDQANLYLTVSTMADRTKKLYGKKVEPDMLTTTAESTNNEAIKWLLE